MKIIWEKAGWDNCFHDGYVEIKVPSFDEPISLHIDTWRNDETNKYWTGIVSISENTIGTPFKTRTEAKNAIIAMIKELGEEITKYFEKK